MRGDFRRQVEQSLWMPEGAISGEPRIEIYAGRRAVIDGECELRVYEEDCLLLGTKSGALRLRGRELHIVTFEKHCITVCGRLSGIEFE